MSNKFDKQLILCKRDQTINELKSNLSKILGKKQEYGRNIDKEYYPIQVLGGCPGIGKTRILMELKKIFSSEEYNIIITIYNHGHSQTDFV